MSAQLHLTVIWNQFESNF